MNLERLLILLNIAEHAGTGVFSKSDDIHWLTQTGYLDRDGLT
jgi:hypothetical protein